MTADNPDPTTMAPATGARCAGGVRQIEPQLFCCIYSFFAGVSHLHASAARHGPWRSPLFILALDLCCRHDFAEQSRQQQRCIQRPGSGAAALHWRCITPTLPARCRLPSMPWKRQNIRGMKSVYSSQLLPQSDNWVAVIELSRTSVGPAGDTLGALARLLEGVETARPLALDLLWKARLLGDAAKHASGRSDVLLMQERILDLL